MCGRGANDQWWVDMNKYRTHDAHHGRVLILPEKNHSLRIFQSAQSKAKSAKLKTRNAKIEIVVGRSRRFHGTALGW